jgi:hypothetical protein
MTLERDETHGNLLKQISATIGILACIGDFGMIYFLAARFPGYSHSLQAVSDLEHKSSPVAPLISIGWIIMGVMFIIFGYGFYKTFHDYGKSAKTAGWMIALYGIGEGILSGLIPGSPGKYLQTTNGVFHSFVGGVGVAGAMLLPFVIVKLFNAAKSSGMYWISSLVTVSGFLFFILFAISNFYQPQGHWISLLGLWQRLYMLMYFLYFIYVATLMLSARKTIRN